MSKYIVVTIIFFSVLALSACSSSDSSTSLTESIWILKELGDEPPLVETYITLEFTDDGIASGTSGCNNYNTTYEVDGKKLTFGEPVAATLMMCPDPIMHQEQEYMTVLAETAEYEIVDDELVLKSADGTKLHKQKVIR